MEEAGIAITLTGVLRIEHSLIVGGARIRAIFLAEPADDRPPKSEGDAESLGAEWVSIDELEHYAFRGPDVEALLRYVANGGPAHPLGGGGPGGGRHPQGALRCDGFRACD